VSGMTWFDFSGGNASRRDFVSGGLVGIRLFHQLECRCIVSKRHPRAHGLMSGGV